MAICPAVIAGSDAQLARALHILAPNDQAVLVRYWPGMSAEQRQQVSDAILRGGMSTAGEQERIMRTGCRFGNW
jgi:hypothetical protein